MSVTHKLISYQALAAKGIPLSQCQIGRLERAGKFPRRVPISAARHAWVEPEIDAYVAAKIAARQPVAA
jgi:prophage regulatory protein